MSNIVLRQNAIATRARRAALLLGSSCLASMAFAGAAQAQSTSGTCTALSDPDTTTTKYHLASPDVLVISVRSDDPPLSSSYSAATAPSVTAVNCETSTTHAITINVTSTGADGAYGAYDEIGGNGGAGGTIFVENLVTGTVSSESGPGMFAYSQGGNGGAGGDGKGFGAGADGGAGGNGGDVTLINQGTAQGYGDYSAAIQGISRGGMAGEGGTGTYLRSGGDGGSGGFSGAKVTANNTGVVLTEGIMSPGISLHSIGGSGNYGGSATSFLWATGGNGGAGGNGGEIDIKNLTTGTIANSGYIETDDDQSKGIEAMSIGGGGGVGGDATAIGFFNSVSIGGTGGRGGQGGIVSVTNDGAIATSGYASIGIGAHSIGGGGGDGGSSQSASVGVGFDYSVAVGGNGGDGGIGKAVSVTHTGSIETGAGTNFDYVIPWAGTFLCCDYASGILAQSIGGGGGNGNQAWAFSAAASDESAVSFGMALGGKAGGGGSGGAVTVDSPGSISTLGRFAPGIIAQSIGGGGGNGGSSMTVSASAGQTSVALSLDLAGVGGTAGAGGAVTTTVAGDITTIGLQSGGVVAQSLSGGGGNGGNVMDTTVAAGNKGYSLGVAIGGKGGTGEAAGTVTSTLAESGTVNTYGDLSNGLLAQSVGGGGGNGGSVQTYAVAVQGGGQGTAGAASVSLGGISGNGGDGGNVTQAIYGNVATSGVYSHGVVAQSIGGGGGNGGHVFALDVAASLDSSETSTEGRAVELSVALGGHGGNGGNGGATTLDMSGGTITTNGEMGVGALVQSIGGGGGNGGNVHSFSVSTALPTSASGLENRLKTNLGLLTGAAKYQANANFGVNVDVGGGSGTGGDGGTAEALLSAATFTTNGEASSGLVVQSIGGGGGVGGNVVANGFIGVSSYNANINVGGKGGTGGNGGAVTVRSSVDGGLGAYVTTFGDHSYGVHAQSIGGGGGIGGSVTSTEYMIKKLSGTSLSLDIGGKGGSGGAGGNVFVGDVTTITSGTNAYGVVAQSIGGGGGSGNISSGGGGSLPDGVGGKITGGTALYLGGNGGDANHGGSVEVTNAIALTSGTGAVGILAQSIGGGGGNAGLASMGKLVSEADQAIGAALKFDIGGSGGDGGAVNIGCANVSFASLEPCVVSVTTTGDAAIGVLAQSIGGGGGLVQVSHGSLGPIDFTVSGTPGGDGKSGRVSVVNHYAGMGRGDITTSGAGAIGILAQSLSEGGGAFIFDAKPATMTDATTENFAGDDNGGVLVDLGTNVTTSGDYAHAILAQALTNAYVVLTPEGQTTYGGAADGETDNLGSTQISIRQGTISTSGDYANAIQVETSSSLSALNENDPTMASKTSGYGYDRAQTIDIAGHVSVTGEGSWGIYSTNLFGDDIDDSTYSTHIIVEGAGTVSAGEGSAGAIYVEDDGNIAIDVYGAVSAEGTGGTAAAINATSKMRVDLDISGTVDGDIVTAVNYNIGEIGITVDGSVNGAISTSSNGGSVTIDARNGVLAATETTAIIIDTNNAVLDLGTVSGMIQGVEAASGMKNATLNAYGTITGTVDGAFAYSFASSDAVHVLNVSGGTMGGDLIWVGSLDTGGSTDRIKINLTQLPTVGYNPLYLVNVYEGIIGAGTAEDLFGLSPDTLATHYDIAITYPSAGAATAMLNGISIDFTRPALDGNLPAVALIANAQVAAYAKGGTSAPTDETLLKYLLMAANETDLTRLEDELTVLEPSLQYNNVTTDSAAVQAALNDLQSCGDDTLASINPIAQGECNWAKFIWRDSQHLEGEQREKAYGLALGRQFEVGNNLHLGVSGVYEDTRFNSATALSRGSRVGAGGILKYSKDANFASLSLMGAYSWADGTRTIVLPEEVGSETLVATAEQKATTFTTRLRGGHLFDLGGVDLTALGDADFIVSHHGGYTEEGAGSLNLVVAPKTNIVFDVRPAAQLGTHVALGAANLRAYGEFGYRVRFGDLDMRAGLANGLDTSFLANVTAQRDRSLPTFGAGLILDLSDRFEARVNYDLEKGERDRLEKFSAKLGYKF